jgi:hypothetical protein
MGDPIMKRKLKLNRETLRHLVKEEVQQIAGGGLTVTCASCYRTCVPPTLLTCAGSVCVHTCITCYCPEI